MAGAQEATRDDGSRTQPATILCLELPSSRQKEASQAGCPPTAVAVDPQEAPHISVVGQGGGEPHNADHALAALHLWTKQADTSEAAGMTGGWERHWPARRYRVGREEGQQARPAQAPAAGQACPAQGRHSAASMAGAAASAGLGACDQKQPARQAGAPGGWCGPPGSQSPAHARH